MFEYKYLKYKNKYLNIKGGMSLKDKKIKQIMTWNITNPDNVNIFEFVNDTNKEFLDIVNNFFFSITDLKIKDLEFFDVKKKIPNKLYKIYDIKQDYLFSLCMTNKLSNEYYKEFEEKIPYEIEKYKKEKKLSLLQEKFKLLCSADWIQPNTRLEYYKTQTIKDFLNYDDGVGVLNFTDEFNVFEHFFQETGTISGITKSCGKYKNLRVGTEDFLITSEDCDKKLLSEIMSKFDLIKLFIFDLILTNIVYFAKYIYYYEISDLEQFILNVKDEIEDDIEINFDTFKEESHLISNDNKWKIINEQLRKNDNDLIVLIELTQPYIENINLSDTYNYISNYIDENDNDIVLFHKKIFQPIIKFIHKYYLICTIGNDIIICVHLPSNKDELQNINLNDILNDILNDSEKQLLMIAGDFNFDLYKDIDTLNIFAPERTILREFINNNKRKLLFSCNTERSILQPQISKAFKTEKTLHDFIIIRKEYSNDNIGFSDDVNMCKIPNDKCPSTHAPITCIL